MSDDAASPAPDAGPGIPQGAVSRETSHHQQTRSARARFRKIRSDGRALRCRGLGDTRRRDRRRHLDHGIDDAVPRGPEHPSSSPRLARRRKPPLDAITDLVASKFNEEIGVTRLRSERQGIFQCGGFILRDAAKTPLLG